MQQVIYKSVWDLFEATRVHARVTGDPSYKPIKLSNKTGRNNSAEHTVPRECWLEIKGQLVTVPAGTKVVLYQDPEAGLTSMKQSHSIGTLYLEDRQITMRGNGHVNCRDLEAWRQRTSMFGFRRGGSKSQSSPDESHYSH